MEALQKQQSLPLLVFALLPFFLLPASSVFQGEDQPHIDCSPFPYECGEVQYKFNISYLFWTKGYPHDCSQPEKEFEITCNQKDNSSEIKIGSHKYHVEMIDYENQTLTIVDMAFFGPDVNLCDLSSLKNITSPVFFEFFSYYSEQPKGNNEDYPNLIFLHNCPFYQEDYPRFIFPNCPSNNATGSRTYFFTLQREIPEKFRGECQLVEIPISKESRDWLEKEPHEGAALKAALENGFQITWSPIDPGNVCGKCIESKGYCGYSNSTPLHPFCYCDGDGEHNPSHTCPPQRPQPSQAPQPPQGPQPSHAPQADSNKKIKRRYVIIGVVCAMVGSILIGAIICFIFYRKRLISSSRSKLLSRALSSDPPLRSDLEKSNSILMTHFFEYKELEEATNNFDPSKELGDGGFGIVYHGELRDGRNVAVKRLYENNCRCVEQFKNEIKILSQLRHQNLVTLYGCSSRHSRELLLVYEFIPNGTVADHLHGDYAKPGALIWPTRMSIAIETADALKYLHAVDIIHRDVKTNNILLDNNFHVKVADFGLSRLFPTNVTHISTAPQGTPGYVDPDYHRCYQLTDKSDVYSFGVVLVELISSKPAVDITRHRHEINLADMALNKIQNCALNELVDPTLEFDSNFGVRRTITLVAELAFRCLQDEKENRPSMEEVLEQLRGIESEEYYVEKVEVNTVANDEALLKKALPLSPDTVTDAWESRTTTPNTSG